MIVHPGNCQHIGARSSQQDAFGFSDKDDHAFAAHGGVLAVVADGMGGMDYGGEASYLAVRAFLHAYMAKHADEAVPAAMLRALGEANQAVGTLAHPASEKNVGTTLVAAVVHGDSLHWVSVGDSRLYLWRSGQLTQLSEDHTYANDLDRDVAKGNLSRRDAENHPQRSSITSYLGLAHLDLISKNTKPFPLVAGDRLLLCSDGLYAALEKTEITPLFGREAQQTAEDMVALVLAKNRPGQDNLTVAILACEPDSAPAAHSVQTTPSSRKLGWFVGGVIAGLVVAGAAYWYFLIAQTPAPVTPITTVAPHAPEATVSNPVAPASAVPEIALPPAIQKEKPVLEKRGAHKSVNKEKTDTESSKIKESDEGKSSTENPAINPDEGGIDTKKPDVKRIDAEKPDAEKPEERKPDIPGATKSKIEI